MIKALLFDWHGVLDHVRLESLFKRIAQVSSIPLEKLKKELTDETRKYALGEITFQEYWMFVEEKTNLPVIKINLLQNYINSIDLNKDVWNMLPLLKKKYSLVILSDCPLEKVEHIRKLPDIKIFDLTLFSGEVHMDKNMDEFFELATNSLKVSGSECLFIDDSERKIQFAQQLGFKTFLFKEAFDLKNHIDNL